MKIEVMQRTKSGARSKEERCCCCNEFNAIAVIHLRYGDSDVGLCFKCAHELRHNLTALLIQNDRSRPLRHGDKGWFVNADLRMLEHATVDAPTYGQDGTLQSFGLDFEPVPGDRVGDYDVFEGRAFNSVFFLSKDEAELELNTVLAGASDDE